MTETAAGWRMLFDWPRATALALFGGVAAQLALRAGLHRARGLVAVAVRELSWPDAAHAALAIFLAVALAGLLSTVTRAAALSAYAAPAGHRPARWAALRVAPALITLGAVEAAVVITLLGGVGLVLLQTQRPTPVSSVLVLAPTLFVVVLLVAATRVAVIFAAREAVPARALVAGIELAFRKFPSLLRLAGAVGLGTLPLLGLAAVAYAGSSLTDGVASVACQIGAALCTTTATLWGYASVAALIEADASAGSTVVVANRAGAA